jgi:hypothetical protein
MNGDLTKKQWTKIMGDVIYTISEIFLFKTTFFVSVFQVTEQEARYRQRTIK